MPEYKENIADILKAIAQPARLKIIDFLMNGEKCVCEIFPVLRPTLNQGNFPALLQVGREVLSQAAM